MKRAILYALIGVSCFLIPSFSHAQSGWQQMAGLQGYIGKSIFFTDSLTGWCTYSYNIYKTTDGGASWKWMQTPYMESTQLNKVIFSNQIGYACGSNGTILKSTDGGATWVLKQSNTTQSLQSIFFLDPLTGWACGGMTNLEPTPGGSTILRTTDGGETWSVQRIPLTYGAVVDIAFATQQHGYCVVNSTVGPGMLATNCYESTDGGITWIAKSIPYHQGAYCIRLVTPSTIAIGGKEGIVMSSDSGTTWDQKWGKDIFIEDIYDLNFSDGKNGWAGGCGLILHTSDGGQHWKSQGVDNSLSFIDGVSCVDSLHAWIISNNRLYRTVNGGQFTIYSPVLQTPVNSAVDQSVKPALSWSAVPTTTAYRLQIATDALFASLVFDSSTISSTSTSISGLQTNTDYFWRVSASNGEQISAWSTTQKFSTCSGIVPLVSPADGAKDLLLQQTLQWTGNQGASEYHLQLSKDSAFAASVITDTVLAATTCLTPALQYATRFYWRVQGKFNSAYYPWSAPRSFTTRAITVDPRITDSLSRYYPLQVDNIWQQKRYMHAGASSGYDTVITRIRKDSVVNNKRYAVVEQSTYTYATGESSNGFYFARFDSSTGCYYEMPSWSTTEVLTDSTATNVPGKYVWGTLTVSYQQSLFDVQSTMRKIDKYPAGYGISQGFYSVWGFGRYGDFYSAIRQDESRTLLFARINGKKYGTMINYPGWKQQSTGTTNRLRALAVIDGSTRIAVGTGVILRTTNGGASWTIQSGAEQKELYGVAFCDAGTGIAVGSGGTILRTVDGGLTWTTVPSGTTEWLWSVTFVNKSIGAIVGANGTILRTLDGGVTWTRQSSGRTQTLCAVSFVDANIGTAVGMGIILRTTDGGETWISQANGVAGTGTYLGVAFSDAVNGTVVGLSGMVLRTTDGGRSWAKQSNGIDPSKNLYGVVFSNASTGVVVGDGGMVFYTTDGGSHWTKQDVGTTGCLFDVSFTTGGGAMVVGDGGMSIQFSTLISGVAKPQPVEQYRLEQNYPNPFNPSTTITFSLPSRSFVTVKIFDVMGREVSTVVSEELSAGNYSRQWNAADMPSGVYFYRLHAGAYSETKSLLLLR